MLRKSRIYNPFQIDNNFEFHFQYLYLYLFKSILRNSLVVPLQRAYVQSLVRPLRFPRPCSKAKKMKRKKNLLYHEHTKIFLSSGRLFMSICFVSESNSILKLFLYKLIEEKWHVLFLKKTMQLTFLQQSACGFLH